MHARTQGVTPNADTYHQLLKAYVNLCHNMILPARAVHAASALTLYAHTRAHAGRDP